MRLTDSFTVPGSLFAGGTNLIDASRPPAQNLDHKTVTKFARIGSLHSGVLARRVAVKRVSALQRKATLGGGLSAWLLATLLVLLFVFDPYAASAVSPLRLHGAMIRDGNIGIVGHRGSAAVAPENTLSAFRIAIEQGVDFVETDVQLTADGVPVLMHDPRVDRTTSGSGSLSRHTFADLRSLDAGSWFSSEFVGEQVPTLAEFTELIRPGTTRAFIELKGDWDAQSVNGVVGLLRAQNLTMRVVLASFEPIALEELRKQAPDFATILLTRELDQKVIDYAVGLRVTAVCARDTLLEKNPKALRKLQEMGIGLVAYTLNTPVQWQQASELGIDFFVTDDPIGLAEWRDSRELSPSQ